ncbi:MAG: precorrin-2 dehydrogenase/sirohydrochlorin ferrochelatase family protein [Lachnospiraceae bacterium]|jgi:precorrin-2 dehydrogenase/sirohydrochlorin ferrochelatase
MAYFPFFVDIEEQNCLIAGGGIVALRKVEVLLPYGPAITVVSPEFAPELRELAEQSGVLLKERDFRMEDLNGADFVVAATDDPALNRQISLSCRENRIPVNVVDVKDECSFIFPSIVREEDVVIGISSGGKSPTVTQDLKQKIRGVIPEGYGRLVRQLGEYRDFVKIRVPDISQRTAIFKRMVDVGRTHDCSLNDQIVEELIDQVKNEWMTK